MLDQEVPGSMVPQTDSPLYRKAEEKEWKDWVKRQILRIVQPEEAEKLRRHTDSRRIIRWRFVCRDKDASIRTPQMPLPVKARARMCAQASRETLDMSGAIKLDSPTVQRLRVMVFLQLIPYLEWVQRWWEGDISSAFLQGREREMETRGRLFWNLPTDGSKE